MVTMNRARLSFRHARALDTSDMDFVMAGYRTMLHTEGHTIFVSMSKTEGDGDDTARTLVARAERKTTITYAVMSDDGTYAMKYASPAFALSSDKSKPVYHFSQSQDGRMDIYQTLTAKTHDASLIFSDKLPHMVTPLMFIEDNTDLSMIMCVQGETSTAVVPRTDENDVISVDGYLYVIRSNMLTGEWTPLFEATKALALNIYGIKSIHGTSGILIANINNKGKPAERLPTHMGELASFVTAAAPNMEAETMNVPFGLSVYQPNRNGFELIPIGGNDNWGITSIRIVTTDETAGTPNTMAIRTCQDTQEDKETDTKAFVSMHDKD